MQSAGGTNILPGGISPYDICTL